MKKIISSALLFIIAASCLGQDFRRIYTSFKSNQKSYYGELSDGKKWYVVEDFSKIGRGDYRGLELDGEIVVPCEYNWLSLNFENNRYINIKDNDHKTIGLYDLQLCKRLPLLGYDDIDIISHTNYAKVKRNMSYGLYDLENLKEIIPTNYDAIEFLKGSNYIKLRSNGSYGLYDLENLKEIISTNYDAIEFSKGSNYIKLRSSNSYGLFDLVRQEEIISPDYDDIDIVPGTNNVMYKMNGFWGVMTLQGKEIISTTRGYTKIKYYRTQKRYAYEMNGYKGECNSLGQQISKIKVDTPQNTSSSYRNTSSPKNSTSNHVSTKQNNTTATSTTPQRQKQQVWKERWNPCISCDPNRKGKCKNCHGQGGYYIGNIYNVCGSCSGTGACPWCNGRGEIKETYSTWE